MTIEILASAADTQLSATDFYDRYLRPAFTQVKLSLVERPAEPVTLEVHFV